MPAYAEEAADLQHGETQLLLVLVRDHIIDSPDLLVLVVDDAAANQLAHPIAFCHDREVYLDELYRQLWQRGTCGEGEREYAPDQGHSESCQGNHGSLLRFQYGYWIIHGGRSSTDHCQFEQPLSKRHLIR